MPSSSWRHPLLTTLSLLGLSLGILGLGGCGGFSAGDAPGLEPPPPPEFAKPETQGEVAGRIRIQEGFLPHLRRRRSLDLRAQKKSQEAEGEGLEAAEETSLPALFRAFRVVLDGVRRTRTAEVEGDGSFRVQKLPRGTYQVRLELGGKALWERTLEVAPRETTQLQIQLLGFDWADLNGDGRRTSWVLESSIQYQASKASRRIIQAGDGSLRAELPDGSREFLLSNGLVRRIHPDGSQTLRPDHDLDGQEDREDPEFQRKKRSLPPEERNREPDRDAWIRGQGVPPWIETFVLEDLFGAEEVGDLGRLRVRVVGGGLGDGLKVQVRVVHVSGATRILKLFDDGSDQDLEPHWSGHQSSGDKAKGDQTYSRILVLDPRTRAWLDDAELVAEALDGENVVHRALLFRYGGHVRTGLGASEDGLEDEIRRVRFLTPRKDPPRILAELEVAPEAGSVLGGLRGRAETRRSLVPQGRTADGWTVFRTKPAPLGKHDLYFVLVSDSRGRAFYAGGRFDTDE